MLLDGLPSPSIRAKVGLVGRNGAGKSTLFALFNGTLHEDGGDFYRPAAWRLAQVAQEMPETEMSATEFVIEGDTRLMAAEAEVKAAGRPTTASAWPTPTWRCTTPARTRRRGARAIVDPRSRLQRRPSSTTRSTASPAAGACACNWRALMCPSDLLLLDEPTNHLDLDALVWLEAGSNATKAP